MTVVLPSLLLNRPPLKRPILDVIGKAAAAYSVRQLRGAYAGPAMNVRRSSDNTTKDIGFVLGNLDTASVTAFGGVDGTFTGTITLTTLTAAALTGQINPGDIISGPGVTVGTAVISGTGPTYTISPSQTVSVGVAMVATIGIYVDEWYDQSGNGNNALQATAATQPMLLFPISSLNGKPALQFLRTATSSLNLPALTVPQPFTYAAVAERTANFTFFGTIFGVVSASKSEVYFSNSANTVGAFAGTGSGFTASAADSIAHSIQSIMNGNTSSTLIVDGVTTTTPGGTPGTNGIGGTAYIGTDQTNNWLNAYMPEGIIFPTALSAAQTTVLRNSQKVYFGTP